VEGVRGYTLRSVTDDVAAVNVAAAHVAAALVFAVADVEATVTLVLVRFSGNQLVLAEIAMNVNE